MYKLVHRIKVFVYRYWQESPEYLLLRRSEGIESFWSPIHGPIGFDEKMETAIRREVASDTGLRRPAEVVDLAMPARWLLGDEEVIEWNFGYHATPESEEVQLSPPWSEFRWAGYSEAFPSLELEYDRAAITRLHAMLHSN